MSVSRALLFVRSRQWNFKESGGNQIAVQTCPFCNNTNYKLFINVSGEDSDGLWDCKVCSQQGNYFQMQERLGLRQKGIVSIQDAASDSHPPPPLPNFSVLHQNLVEDERYAEVLDYLVAGRGLSMDVIEKYKIGAREKDGALWVVIPYFDAAGAPVYYKERTASATEKRFGAPSGREAPLFNGAILKHGMKEIIFVEGEMDCLSMLSNGYTNVVGVPGAGVKKASWIERLDQVAPENIYILYDNDKAGQAGARALAERIGIDKAKNVVLPKFSNSEEKLGKDVNDWFLAGFSKEDLDALISSSSFFNVEGVQPLSEVLDELRDAILMRGTDPTYKSPWPSLTKRVGGFEKGDLVGLMAEAKVGKTTMALNWLEWNRRQGIDSLMFCQEMQPVRMVRKWVSLVTRTPDTPGASKLTTDTIQQALEFARSGGGDLLFGFTKSCKLEDVMNTIRQAVRRYGVKWVCFDNLQMLVRSLEHAAAETNKLSKAFKALAMELGIVILLVIQPHRVPDGQIISSRNAMGSSAIEKDVDCMVCLHRNRLGVLKKEVDFKGFIESEENFDQNLLVRADLTRYAPGGACTLIIDGAISEVRELTGDDIVTQPASGLGIIPTDVSAV